MRQAQPAQGLMFAHRGKGVDSGTELLHPSRQSLTKGNSSTGGPLSPSSQDPNSGAKTDLGSSCCGSVVNKSDWELPHEVGTATKTNKNKEIYDEVVNGSRCQDFINDKGKLDK